MNYQQVEKNTVRNESLKNAISFLTKKRTQSTIASRNYIRNAKEHLLNEKNEYVNLLTEETILRWENFYNSIVGRKKPSELKVAYLCGPNPLNDLEIMVEMGILPENVWAFELDKALYNEALNNSSKSNYSYLKIINGKMETFFEHTPIKFDIIYFDACAPLPSKNSKTLKTIVSIFQNHKLNSPSALITNFSLPTKEQDPKTRNTLSKIIAMYLCPKGFIESNKASHNNTECELIGVDDEELFKYIEEDLENYYGQYITRLISDIATIIIPFQRLYKNKDFLGILFENLFENQNDKKLNEILEKELNNFIEFIDEDECLIEDNEKNFKKFTSDNIDELFQNIMSEEKYSFESFYDLSEIMEVNNMEIEANGNVYADPWLFAILWSIYEIDKNLKGSTLSKTFINDLSILKNKDDFIKSIKIIYYLLNDGLKETYFYSPSLKKLHKDWEPYSKHYFCDLFLFHQLKELLFGQIAVPYILNIEKTRRWTYQAKETRMFTDMLIFDECRYVYDWMPTLDMLELNLENEQIEISLRLALDSISKHLRYYNNDYFFGTAAIGEDGKKYSGKLLKVRNIIN